MCSLFNNEHILFQTYLAFGWKPYLNAHLADFGLKVPTYFLNKKTFSHNIVIDSMRYFSTIVLN